MPTEQPRHESQPLHAGDAAAGASPSAEFPEKLPGAGELPGGLPGAWALWRNPVAQRCRRARLRPKHLLTWGLIGLSSISFVFFIVLLPGLHHLDVDIATAAKATLLPLLVIQGVVLMGAGTMAVATGIARERDRELIDYQRMTPMSPTAKIVGYLFGLPAREYFFFALTLPFVAYVVWVGGVSVYKLAHYYTVFFSSVWVYHMTGLTAGMVSRKPWQSAAMSLGAVAALYLVLPNLSWVGLTIFEYLTVRPTFYGMILAEVQQARPGFGPPAEFFIHRYGDVPFFGWRIDPTLFSLALQGFVLVTLYTVVRRKWIDPSWHAFSKRFAVVFVLAVHVLVVGSIWPLLRDTTLLGRLTEQMPRNARAYMLGVLLGLFLAISTAAVLFVTFLITPEGATARKGFRRARKLGKRDTPASWDAGPALRWVLGLLLIAAAGYTATVYAAVSGGQVFRGAVPWPWVVMPAAVVVPAALFFHGVAARFGSRVLVLSVFVLWVMPVMVMAVIGLSTGDEVLAFYVGSVFPGWPAILALLHLSELSGGVAGSSIGALNDGIVRHLPVWIGLNAGLYTLLAMGVQSHRLRWARAWRGRERGRDIV